MMAYYTQEQGLLSQRRGSTKTSTDVNQNTQASYIYDAWGNILQSSGTITNPYLYVGELGYYADGDTGMYLLTQRWYNPVVGRFVARDPWKEGNNLFVYARDNPAYFVDQEGTFCWHIPGDCVGTTCHGDFTCPSAGHGSLARHWKCLKELGCMLAGVAGLCEVSFGPVETACALGCMASGAGYTACVVTCLGSLEAGKLACLLAMSPVAIINCIYNGTTPCLDNVRSIIRCIIYYSRCCL